MGTSSKRLRRSNEKYSWRYPFNQINLLDTFIIEHAEMMIDRLQVLQSSMPDLPNQLSNETLIKTLEETIEDLQWLILV